MPDVFELEKHMVSFECGMANAPREAIEIVKEGFGSGPLGFALYNNKWYVLASGQGPFIVWSEEDESKKTD